LTNTTESESETLTLHNLCLTSPLDNSDTELRIWEPLIKNVAKRVLL
jgi:hypothetical protein